MRSTAFGSFAAGVLISAFLLSVSVRSLAALPPQHESARLMLAIESAIDAKDWLLAERQLATLDALDVEPPVRYLYFAGKIAAELGQPRRAIENLEKYVISAGDSGQFYQPALKLLTRLEQQRAVEEADNETRAELLPATAPDDDGDYLQSLLDLYLTADPVEALTLQVNSLLTAHAYTGKRIKSAAIKDGIVYALTVDQNRLLLQEKHYENGAPTLKVSQLDVPGIDPFIRYGCGVKALACWVYHPVRPEERWISIDRDPTVARELAKALTRLIQILQQRK